MERKPGHNGKTSHWRKERKQCPPEGTLEEVRYIKHLIENQVPVRIKLEDNTEVTGVIEYYDESFIRLTRIGKPNLFIYKQRIKYLWEDPPKGDTPLS